MATPSVGRIVHYFNGTLCQAAIVTDVTPPLPHGDIPDPVALTVFPELVTLSPVGYDPVAHRGTWHWPERAE